MEENRFKYYNYLGFHNPYYTVSNNKIKLFEDFGSAIESVKDRVLDKSSVIEILCNGYILGDKTIIKGVYKTPWMAKPNPYNTDWDFFDVPDHEEEVVSEINAATQLYDLLEQEVYGYVKDHHHIGILLTGGMDSRIVACVLNNLVKNGKLKEKEIFAFTWGLENSRDVQYAKRIASIFGWKWKGIEVDTAQMRRNVEACVLNGCEFSPLHLHAMIEVSETNAIDCVLAGSFGDSIGRGEYSGVKVENLSLITKNLRNFGGFMRKSNFQETIAASRNEVSRYHELFPQSKNYQMFEQDMQLHYMRRMLNPCMAIINKKIPLFQVFTSPEVYSYIWKLNPIVRKDSLYEIILKNWGSSLSNIPWARTGLIYPKVEGEQVDDFTKKHHKYGDMIRESFLTEIQEAIQSAKFANLNIFEIGAIKRILRYCKSKPIKGSYYYEEKLLWLQCLSRLIDKYDIKGDTMRGRPDVFSITEDAFKYRAKYFMKTINSR